MLTIDVARCPPPTRRGATGTRVGPAMVRANAPAAGGQFQPDLTRAVCGMSWRSRPALAMHKHTGLAEHTGWPLCLHGRGGDRQRCGELLITARRAAAMHVLGADAGARLRPADLDVLCARRIGCGADGVAVVAPCPACA